MRIKRCSQLIFGICGALVITALLWLSACAPSGPEALIRGEQLVQEGKYELAMGKLEMAVSSMPTNANAWNLLGVAYHGIKETEKAQAAYEQALALDRNLHSVRYNLGCLFLENHVLPYAISNLTIFTTMQPTSSEGWVKLGEAYNDFQQFQASSICYSNALKFRPQNPAIWNSLGMALIQRGKPRESLTCFTTAMQCQSNYAPAVLNLAILYHQHLHNHALAVQKYREFLTLQPNSEQSVAIEQLVMRIEEELKPPAKTAPTNVVVAATQTKATQTNQSIATNELLLSAVQRTKTADLAPPKTDLTSQNNASNQTTRSVGRTNLTVIPAKKDNQETSPPTVVRKVDTREETQDNSASAQKTLSGSTTNTQAMIKVASNKVESKAASIGRMDPAAPNRYPYRSPATPKGGNRAEADRWLAEASRERQADRWQPAVALYQKAAQADPSSFDARFNLGLAALYSGQIPQALIEFEVALAILPDSYQARFNFAFALEKAHYVRDAIQQLEILQKQFPQDARIPLQMGKWYAEGLGQNHLARICYLRVLELDSQHPQATAIRYWLAAHP